MRLTGLALALLAVPSVAWGQPPAPAQKPKVKPNIVFVLFDDIGYLPLTSPHDPVVPSPAFKKRAKSVTTATS